MLFKTKKILSYFGLLFIIYVIVFISISIFNYNKVNYSIIPKNNFIFNVLKDTILHKDTLKIIVVNQSKHLINKGITIFTDTNKVMRAKFDSTIKIINSEQSKLRKENVILQKNSKRNIAFFENIMNKNVEIYSFLVSLLLFSIYFLFFKIKIKPFDISIKNNLDAVTIKNNLLLDEINNEETNNYLTKIKSLENELKDYKLLIESINKKVIRPYEEYFINVGRKYPIIESDKPIFISKLIESFFMIYHGFGFLKNRNNKIHAINFKVITSNNNDSLNKEEKELLKELKDNTTGFNTPNRILFFKDLMNQYLLKKLENVYPEGYIFK